MHAGRDEKQVAEAIGADSCIYNEISCLEDAVRDCLPEELRWAQLHLILSPSLVRIWRLHFGTTTASKALPRPLALALALALSLSLSRSLALLLSLSNSVAMCDVPQGRDRTPI